IRALHGVEELAIRQVLLADLEEADSGGEEPPGVIEDAGRTRGATRADRVDRGKANQSQVLSPQSSSRGAGRGWRISGGIGRQEAAANRSMNRVESRPSTKSGSSRIRRCIGMVVLIPSTTNRSSARRAREIASIRVRP